MDYTCRTRALSTLVKNMTAGTIQLTHKLQRKEGQWNNKQKSDLIDSLLRKYPINPTYAIKENSTLYVIDGVQRLSTVRDYINNSFALSKDLDPVEVNGIEKDIAGKKFKKLDEETQEAITGAELQIYELIACSEKDVREMFRRQNAGKVLSNGQLRVVIESDELSNIICSLAKHPFIQKILTPAQKKKDLDKDIVREIIMLTEASDEYDFGSFRSKDIDAFIEYYNDNINEEKINILKSGLDRLNEAFGDDVKIKQTSIPMVCYGIYEVIMDNKNTEKYIDWLHNFIDTYDTNEEYKQYCNGAGTAGSDMVKGRLQYFSDVIQEL